MFLLMIGQGITGLWFSEYDLYTAPIRSQMKSWVGREMKPLWRLFNLIQNKGFDPVCLQECRDFRKRVSHLCNSYLFFLLMLSIVIPITAVIIWRKNANVMLLTSAMFRVKKCFKRTVWCGLRLCQTINAVRSLTRRRAGIFRPAELMASW